MCFISTIHSPSRNWTKTLQDSDNVDAILKLERKNFRSNDFKWLSLSKISFKAHSLALYTDRLLGVPVSLVISCPWLWNWVNTTYGLEHKGRACVPEVILSAQIRALQLKDLPWSSNHLLQWIHKWAKHSLHSQNLMDLYSSGLSWASMTSWEQCSASRKHTCCTCTQELDWERKT